LQSGAAPLSNRFAMDRDFQAVLQERCRIAAEQRKRLNDNHKKRLSSLSPAKSSSPSTAKRLSSKHGREIGTSVISQWRDRVELPQAEPTRINSALYERPVVTKKENDAWASSADNYTSSVNLEIAESFYQGDKSGENCFIFYLRLEISGCCQETRRMKPGEVV